MLSHQLCELELRAGNWTDAERWLEEWHNERTEGQTEPDALRRCRALLAAGRGDAATALALADRAGREPTPNAWHALEADRAAGLARLLAGEPRRRGPR